MTKTKKDPGFDMDGDTFLKAAIAQAQRESGKPGAKSKDIDAMLGNPLHGAIRTNCMELFDVLLAQGVNIDSTNQYGDNTIHTAINQRKHNFLRRLIESGAALDKPDRHGRSPVFLAVTLDDNDALKMLLDAGFAPSSSTKTTSTAIHSAVVRGNEEAVRLLLDAGVAIDIPAPIHRNKTPLHLAAAYGRKAIIELLAAAGANLSARMDEGYLPIHCTKIQKYESPSEREGGIAAFEALLEAGSPFELIETDDHFNSKDWNEAAQGLYSAHLKADIEDSLAGIKATKPPRSGLSL